VRKTIAKPFFSGECAFGSWRVKLELSLATAVWIEKANESIPLAASTLKRKHGLASRFAASAWPQSFRYAVRAEDVKARSLYSAQYRACERGSGEAVGVLTMQGTLVVWHSLPPGTSVPCEQILDIVYTRCSLAPAEFDVSLLTPTGEHVRAGRLHAGDYTLIVRTGLVDSKEMCLKDPEGRTMSSWLLSLPGSPHLGQDMPTLDGSNFVEARIELPPEAVQPEYVYSDSDTEMY
jgi:hypothetical protein